METKFDPDFDPTLLKLAISEDLSTYENKLNRKISYLVR